MWLTVDEVMDVKSIALEDKKFDVVFDKATLDCFFVGLYNPGRKRFD